MSEKEIKDFFNKWQVYQVFMQEDYMYHNEMSERLHQLLVERFSTPFKLLHLGCGDASYMTHTIDNTHIADYVCMDISSVALDYAMKNMHTHSFKKKFIEGNFYDDLEKAGADFDIICIGYSLHHIKGKDKASFLQRCKKLLKENGCIVLVDIYREENETRDEYMGRFVDAVKHQYTAFNPEQQALVIDHVTNNDYPEKISEMKATANKIGFTSADVLLKKDFYVFVLFN